MWSMQKLVIFSLTFIGISHISDGLKILGVFPLPGRSHFVLAEELFKELAQKGHTIDVISHFPQKKPFPNYNDISLAGTLPLTTNNITFGMTQKMTGFGTFGTFVETAGTMPCKLLGHPELQKVLKKPKNSYDVVVVELFAAQCYIAFGQHFNVPVVGVVVSRLHDWLYAPFGNPFNKAYMSSIFSSNNQYMNFKQRLGNLAISTLFSTQFNYYIENQCEIVEKYFNRKLSSIHELYDDVSLLLVNSHYSLNEIKPATPDIIEIGGLHISGTGQDLSEDLKKWLDESTEGFVYVTFGSMVRIETLPTDKLDAFYQMFRRIAPVRVLVKITDPSLLPPNLPKNVKTSSWFPQVAVLKHKNIKAFVTHGGLLGTQEALAWGVPLVGMPLFGDQHANIHSYVEKKIAVMVNVQTFDADSLTNAVETILKDPEYQENMNAASTLFMDRPMNPKDTAIYWIKYAVRHGNRLKSPATKLTWWKLYLLDVYGFILGSVLLVLYIVKKILVFIYRLFCSRKNSKQSSKSSTMLKKNK